MYKSKLECPKCSHVGVKFDPYMYLSLNLPESKLRTLHMIVLYVDGSRPPLQHAVDVPKTGTAAQPQIVICAPLVGGIADIVDMCMCGFHCARTRLRTLHKLTSHQDTFES